MRTYLVWRTFELSYLGVVAVVAVVVVVHEINVVGGWCCMHLFRVGTNVSRTQVPCVAYLGVAVVAVVVVFTLLRTW